MEKRKGIRVLILALIISSISGAPHNSLKFDDSYRLPKSVIPKSYELSLESSVHLQGLANFGGNVKIQIEILDEAYEIILNSLDLKIEKVLLFDNNGNEMEKFHNLNEEKEFLVITPLDALLKGQTYILEISFNGHLNTVGPNGFYRSQYQVAGEAEPRYLAGTQFEPTRARRAFPCFDEPEYKATFKLSIIHGSSYHALSNTEGETVNIDNEQSKTTFRETPKMSTYLLAFVISDLEYHVMSNPDGLRHRVYARPEYVDKGYTLPGHLFSEQFLKLLEEKFSFKFDPKIGKLDSVAMPDHDSAMENWGLILYKEKYLILETNPHPYEIYDVVGTIAHEIAHQFFGNVVTFKWFDQIWLNEGFATWIEFQLPELSSMTKDLRFYEFFNIRRTHVALHSDSLESTRPMTHDVSKPSEIGSLFDDIAYDKSGAVLRMFQYAIGDDIFNAGVVKYLTTHQYDSVTSDDFLSSLESVLPAPFAFEVTRAFKTWELNKGYPMITVKFHSNQKQFQITQKRYLSASEEQSKADNTSWYIPLSYTTGVNPNFNDGKFTDFFPDGDAEKLISTAHIPEFDGSQWFIFNKHQLGYYRVNYDEQNWNKIIKVLNSENFKQIHVLNRAQLVDDALTFAFDGVISYDIAFEIVSYLSKETDYIPWYAASLAFDRLDFILKGTDFYKDFQRFISILIRRLYTEHDFNSINSLSNSEQLAVELAIDWSCRVGNERCLKNAYNQMKTRNILKPLEPTYICNGMKGTNDTKEYEYHFDRMTNSIIQNERMRIIKGLVCSNDENILNKFIHSAVVGNTYYRGFEIQKILGSVVEKSSIGLELLAGLIEDHFDDIVMKTNEGYVETLLMNAAKRISTEQDEMIVSNIINDLEGTGRKVKQSTKDSIAKHIKFNKEWSTSSMSSSLSVFIHNSLKAYDEFEKVLRLPKIAVPTRYKVHLDVRNVQDGALPYSGEVRIDVHILEVTDKIIFHSKDHKIDEIKVVSRLTNQEVRILDSSQNKDTDTLSIYFADYLQFRENIEIFIKFSAELTKIYDGFFLDSYLEFDEFAYPVTKYLATTQFQAVEARRAFPCFDEPQYKTQFDISILHDSSYNAVSNMPVIQLVLNDDKTSITVFDSTPVMSTYLLAFLVSDFKYLSNEATLQQGQTLQRIYTRPGKEENAKYGLENSIKLLDELEKFVQMKFDLPKIDSGAIPGKGGGMENWGLILYREQALVYENKDDEIGHDAKQRGVRLIAHEIAHMFFGNLVTAEWWNYLWLNEGFATYLMYQLTDILYPEWHMKEFYNRNILLSGAFPIDATDETRSMSSELITVDDINNSFDDITYDKASCVIRMFHYAIGEEVFKEALTLYLNENKYKSVNSQHLINAIQQTLNSRSISLDFERMFRTWEMQAGVPIVNVEYQAATSSFHLTQERFFNNKSKNVDDKSSWHIPINYGTASNINFNDTSISYYFPDGQKELFINDMIYNGNEWFIFNKQQIGYYRVNYDEKNWNRLTEALNSDDFEAIHISNRVQLIDDAFALALAEYIDLHIPYEIIMYLRNEADFFAWDIASDRIYDLFKIFGDRNEDLNLFMYHLSKHFYSHYDLSNEEFIPKDSMPERYGRELAIDIACAAGNENCMKDAIKFGSKDVKDEQRIPTGLEEVILCNYFQNTESDAEFISIFTRMNKLYQPSESSYKTALINSLACTKNPDFLYEFLESSIGMHENNVNYTQSQKRAVFNAVLKNANGMSAVFKLIANYNGREMVEGYGWLWSRILGNIAGSVYTEQEKYIFIEFISNVDHPGLSREDIERAVEEADENLKKQKLDMNARQIKFILELIEREFVESTTTDGTITTTSSQPTTISTTSSQHTAISTTSSQHTAISTTTNVMTTTTPGTTSVTIPTTTPDNASSIKVNLTILLVCIAIGLFIDL